MRNHVLNIIKIKSKPKRHVRNHLSATNVIYQDEEKPNRTFPYKRKLQEWGLGARSVSVKCQIDAEQKKSLEIRDSLEINVKYFKLLISTR